MKRMLLTLDLITARERERKSESDLKLIIQRRFMLDFQHPTSIGRKLF